MFPCLRRTGLRAAAVVFGLSIAGCVGLQIEGDVVRVEAPTPPIDGKVVVGKGYVDFRAPVLGGGELQLADEVAAHPVVVLQFWGIRCAPCLAEMEFLSELQKEFGPRGLEVIGVNTDRVDGVTLDKAMAQRGLEPGYPIVLDRDFSIATHYTNWLIPVSVLIDGTGTVRVVHTGFKPDMAGRIRQEILELLP